MMNQNPKSQHESDRPADDRLQPDPMLRRTYLPWGWGIVAVAAAAVIAVLLFGTNQEPDKAVGPAPSNPPITTGKSGPIPPQTGPNSGRGSAAAPPAATGAAKTPDQRNTPGTGQ